MRMVPAGTTVTAGRALPLLCDRAVLDFRSAPMANGISFIRRPNHYPNPRTRNRYSLIIGSASSPGSPNTFEVTAHYRNRRAKSEPAMAERAL